MRKQNGITLVALVITVILMLILAGVVLNLAIDENGLIKIASNTAEKYKLEEIREKVDIAMANVIAKETALGNEITIEKVLQELLEDQTFESIDKENSIGNIGDYEVKLKENEDGSIVIEYVQKATGIRITYSLDPKGYTNSEKVSILFKVDGEVKSVKKPDGLVAYPKQGKIALDYEVDKNGKYQFIVENEEGTLITKEVIIDTIDRLAPEEFTITASQVEDKLVITANAQDAEADGMSVKSGIDKYEYFVKKSTDTEYPETFYTTNEIEGLAYDTYTVYAKAYDKAGNSIESSNEVTVKIIDPKVAKYGKKVNYEANGVTDWKVFYIEDDETKPNYGCTYIITSDYLNYYEMTDKSPITNLNMKLYSGNYCLNWSSTTIPKYNANIDLTSDAENGYIGIRDMFLLKWNLSKTFNNIRCVSALLNTTAWSPFADGTSNGKQITNSYAIGSPTADMWVASWNETYPSNSITLTVKNAGYEFSRSSVNNSDKLYFPRSEKIGKCDGYMLASPHSYHQNFWSYVTYGGTFMRCAYTYETGAVRPVVCLPNGTTLTYDATTGMYNINQI